jgi:hypothetical protein
LSGFAEKDTDVVREFPTDGGDISIRAGKNILAAQSQQLASPWFWRQAAGAFGLNTFDTLWAVDIAKFEQGVAAFGGGDITVQAGAGISNLSVSVPTTGIVKDNSGSKQLLQWGGGDFLVSARDNIEGGAFYAGRGQGLVETLGGVEPGAAITISNVEKVVPTALLLGDAQITIAAGQGVEIGAAVNPTVTPYSAATGSLYTTSFFTYSENSGVTLHSLSDDIQLATQSDYRSLFSTTIAPATPSPNNGYNSAYKTFPGTLKAVAFGGDINRVNNFNLFPAALGQLELIAKGNVKAGVSGGNSTIVYDADPAQLPSPMTATKDSTTGRFYGDLLQTHARLPLHSPDPEPIYIVADEGDIEGRYTLPKSAKFYAGHDIVKLYLLGQNLHDTDVTLLQAGRDIRYSNEIENALQPTKYIRLRGPGRLDLIAGRNVILGGMEGVTSEGDTSFPALPNKGASVNVMAGMAPGANNEEFVTRYLKVHSLQTSFTEAMRSASGNTELSSVQALDYFNNSSEQDQAQWLADLELTSADVKVFADILDFQAQKDLFANSVRNIAGNSQLTDSEVYTVYQKLAESKQAAVRADSKLAVDKIAIIGDTLQYQKDAIRRLALLNGGEASGLIEYRDDGSYVVRYTQEDLESFARLSELDQRSVIIRAFFQELRESGRHALNKDTKNDYSRADAAIATLFPEDKKYEGDLTMFSSRIYTLDGGDINILTPGGSVNGGLPVPAKPNPAQTGVVAVDEGEVRTFSKGDFIVNQARVFTLLGGDIIMWSTAGDIDAGRGAKEASSSARPQITVDDQGNLIPVLTAAVSGSGIRAKSTDPLRVKPGDVYLFAPSGIIDAGDAGIGATNLYAGATDIKGAENIDIGGQAFGVPALAPQVVQTDFGGSNDIADSIKKSTEKTVDQAVDDNSNTPIADAALSYLEVFVIGLGEDTGQGDKSSEGKD